MYNVHLLFREREEKRGLNISFRFRAKSRGVVNSSLHNYILKEVISIVYVYECPGIGFLSFS